MNERNIISSIENILKEKSKLQEEVVYMIICWKELLENNYRDVKQSAYKKLSEKMSEMSRGFYEKFGDSDQVELRKRYFKKYDSVIIREPAPFLFPYDFVRFSSSKEFSVNIIEELNSSISNGDTLTLSAFITKIQVIAQDNYSLAIHALNVLTKKGDKFDETVNHIILSWIEFLRDNRDEVLNFEINSVKEKMADMAVRFSEEFKDYVPVQSRCEKCGNQVEYNDNQCSRCGVILRRIVIRWSEQYFNNYYSLLIKNNNRLSFLYPYDLFRFSLFIDIEKLCNDLELYSFNNPGEKISLSDFVDKLSSVSNESIAKLTNREWSFIKEMTELETTGKSNVDFKRMWTVFKGNRYKMQLEEKLRELGIMICSAKTNFCALGLSCYIVYCDGNLNIKNEWDEFVRLRINCNDNKKVLVIFIPTTKLDKALKYLKRMGDTSEIVRNGCRYNFSLYDEENKKWNINVRNLLLESQNRDTLPLTFTVIESLENSEAVEITDQFIQISIHITTVEYIESAELVKLTGIPKSSVNYQIRKMHRESVVKPYVSINYVGLSALYYVFIENKGNNELIKALLHFPRIFLYEFQKYSIFILSLPQQEIYPLDEFLSQYKGGSGILSKGKMTLGENYELKKLNLQKLRQKDNKGWKFSVDSI
ncbi:MAG: hypothetical protein ACFFD4_27410 [Candidatus Odinarchaeota archaeon]